MKPVDSVASETELLLEAFSSFAEVSTSLEKAYHSLQEKVKELSHELERKNYYLESVLQNLPCGVLVVDSMGRVTLMNRRARQLLELEKVNLPARLEVVLGGSPHGCGLAEIFSWDASASEISIGTGPDRRVLACLWGRMRAGERILTVQDVTRQRRLEEKMKEAERLAAMGEMAVEVAHEIRNPLASLELFASLLRENDLSPEDHLRYVDLIQLGIRSLNTVLSNLLTWSRNPEPHRRAVEVNAILRQIIDFMRPLCDQRSILFRPRLEAEKPAFADPDMLRQVFTNLVLNALQALPEGGRVQIRSRDVGPWVEVVVQDNGVGIPEELQSRIFEPGFTTSKNGSGLGLAIVHRMVRAHGGSIRLFSRIGRGTRFVLRFPALAGEGGGR